MPITALSRAVAFIKAGQNSDGGWGYRPAGKSFVEPTGLCLAALASSGETAALGPGRRYLKACQRESGAVGVDPQDADGGWMAYAALLGFRALGAAAEEGRLRDWMLRFEDASKRFSASDISAIKDRYGYDASLPGWPWTPGTTGWVEPTALFIVALVRSGVPTTEGRIKSGVDMIVDQRVRSGGWNYGNPRSGSHELEASPMSTALALAALAAANHPEDKLAVREGLRFAGRALAGDISTASLAWTVLALKSLKAGAALLPGAAARLAGLQAPDGGFRGNLYETALSAVILDKPSLLIAKAGGAG